MNKSLILLLTAVITAYGQIPQYEVTMAPADYRLLFTRDIFSDSLIPATFESGGTYWNDAQIRFKGHSTRYYPKKSFRVKFSSSHPFGWRRQVDFNSMYTDKSMIREMLVWDLFTDMNQLAPHGYHCNFTLNGELKGLYLLIDKVDKYFLQNRGRTVAPMYQANDTYTAADLTVQPDSLLKLYYDKEVGSSTDYSDLVRLIYAINFAPDNSFADTVRKYFDVSSILNWFAGNIVSMMGDSYVKNYFLYRDTSRATQQWTIIPWDYDLSFGRSGDLAIPYPASLLNDGFAYTFPPLSGPSNVLKDRFMASPVLMEELRLYVGTILQTIFIEERLYRSIDSLSALLENDVARDPQKWGTIDDFHDHIDALKYYVTARRNYLLKTYINPPGGEYDIVTLPVSEIGVPYHFVSYDGRQIASLWFNAMQGLDSIRVRAYPDSTPPGIPDPGDQKYVRRWIEIIPYPSGARFTAKLQWMYSDVSSLDREVGSSVQDERLLRCYLSDGGVWTQISAKLNPFANTVMVDSFTQDQCGMHKFLALRLPESYTQKWFRQPTNYWQRWHDVKFTDKLSGFIAGEHGTVLRTSDGGISWQDGYLGASLPLTSISIDSTNNVYIAGENGLLYRSSDAGSSWRRVDLGVTQNIHGVFFESGQIGWIYGEKGLLLKTTNDGASWVDRAVDSLKNIIGMVNQSSNITAVYLEDGGDAKTTDGGATWQWGTAWTSRKLTGVKMAGGQHWIIGDSGLVLSAPSIGLYQNISVPTPAMIHDLCVINPAILYAACDGGKIFYTTDSGTSWYSQYTADSHDLLALAFTDSAHGCAVGSGGTILITTSAGTVTGLKTTGLEMPGEFKLHQNYPNPFNPVTTVAYDLPNDSRVILKVFNILGQELRTLTDGTETAGYKAVRWDACGLASGIYFYRLETAALINPGKTLIQVRKAILLR